MTEKITVNAQNSIRIDGECVIWFDPFRIENAAHDADIIFITHAHHDHFSPDDIAKLAKEDTVYVSPESMRGAMLALDIPPERLVTFTPGSSGEVCGIPVEAIASYNIGKPMHPKKNGWLGYTVTVGGVRIYVGGDMDATPEGEAVKCDIAMITIGGTFTMNAQSAAKLINVMQPKIAIPTHYGTLVGSPKDAKVFRELVDARIEVCEKLFV